MRAKPVILLVFANDRSEEERYLRNVVEERRQLERILRPLQTEGLAEVVVLPNATVDDLLTSLREHSGRIALLHYGGHANSFSLLLETSDGASDEVSGGGLALRLGQEHNLKLVFLNGCLTEPHAEELLAGGVPAVVGTTIQVEDETALSFAANFYTELAGGASIDSAYQRSVAAGRMRNSNSSGGYHVVNEQPVLNPVAWPWLLRLRDGASEVRNWNIPAAAGDYLFGLPSLPAGALPDNPFHRALAWYGRNEAEIFFGRGRQIRELYQRLTTVDGSPVVLLCGQSGVGKSSLLEAGLIPRLQAKYQVCYVRRERTLGAGGSLRAALDLPPSASDATVAAAWRNCEQQQNRPLLLLLDQVEEIFTRPFAAPDSATGPNSPEDEIAALAATAAALFGAPAARPHGRLLLSFRKEYLLEVEKPLREQAVDRTHVFLERMDSDSIVEVVEGPSNDEKRPNHNQRLAQKYNLTVDDGLAEEIARDLTADPASPIATILQILLTEMWDTAYQRSMAAPHFDLALYEEWRRSGVRLQRFFDQRIAEFARHQPDAVNSGLLLDLLAFHTTTQGAAEQRSHLELAQEYGPSQELERIIQTSKELRLLSDPIGQTQDQVRTKGARLAHDTLAPIVREAYVTSSRPGQRTRRMLESRITDWQAEQHGPSRNGSPDSHQSVFDEADLKTVENGLHGMRLLTPPEQELVQASRQRRSRTQRQRRSLFALAAAALISILLLTAASIWFGLASQANATEAQNQKATAQANALEAEREKTARESQLVLSQSREVAAVAENLLRNGNSQTSLGLSLVAFTEITNTAQAETALRASLNEWQGLASFSGHTASVTGIFFSKDGRYLASASVDDTARLWDLITGAPIFTVDEHKGDVTAALISEDSRYLVTSSRDGSVRTWSIPDGEQVSEIRLEGITDGIRSMSLHANGRWIGLRAGTQIWLYDIATGEEVENSPYFVPGDTSIALRSLAFTADGKQILAGGDDTMPHIWEISSGATAALSPPEGIPGHQESVLNFQQTNDEHFLASLSSDRIMPLGKVT